MNLSFTGGKRPVVVLTAAVLIGLAGCGGKSSSDDVPAAKATTSATPTPDPAEVDEAAVMDLAERFWAAVVQSENTGNDDPAQFADVAMPAVIENQLATVTQYQELDLLRVGQPAITEIEAAVDGDTAQILLCLNEDDWTAEVNGEPAGDGKKFGNGAWGATAQKVDGRWLIAEKTIPSEGAKACA